MRIRPLSPLLLAAGLLVAAQMIGCATAPTKTPPASPPPGLRFALNYQYDPQSKAHWASSIDVFRGLKRIQHLEVPLGSCDLEKAALKAGRDPLTEKDFDFDGSADLFLWSSSSGKSITLGCVWLYNPARDQFEYSDALSSLSSLDVDPKRKWVLSYETSGNPIQRADGSVYAWQGKELRLLYDMRQTETGPRPGTARREVTQYSGQPRRRAKGKAHGKSSKPSAGEGGETIETLLCTAEITPKDVRYLKGNAEDCLFGIWPAR
jgi:hypothetical protein